MSFERDGVTYTYPIDFQTGNAYWASHRGADKTFKIPPVDEWCPTCGLPLPTWDGVDEVYVRGLDRKPGAFYRDRTYRCCPSPGCHRFAQRQVDLSLLDYRLLSLRDSLQQHAECIIKESGRSPLSQAVLTSLGSLKETAQKILDAADTDLLAEPINHGAMAQHLQQEGWYVGSLLSAMPDTTFSTPPKR